MSAREINYLYEQSPLDIDYSDQKLIRMNLNENLVFPESLLRSILAKCTDRLDPRFYPDELGTGETDSLCEEIAKYCACSKSSVAIGVGGDQLIDVIFRIKLGGTSARLFSVDPTFPLYSVFAARQGVRLILCRINNSTSERPFSLPKKELIEVCKTKKPGLLVLASPNNPTAVQYPEEEIREILDSIPSQTGLLLDEAYVEFAEYDGARKFLRSYQNLVILRTFSKAFALASMRLGYILSSDTNFIDQFNNRFQYPFPVAGLSIKMAIELLKRKSVVIEYAEKIKTFRQELIDSLQKFHKVLRVIPVSNANFVVVQSRDSRKVAGELLSRYAIAVKYIPVMGKEKEFLRITVGSREINQKLLYALRRIVLS